MESASTLLRRARAQAGLTQAEVAERLGVSQAAVARLEQPGSNPTMRTLANALHATGHRLSLGADHYKPSIDETLIARRLRMTPAERIADFEQSYGGARALALAGRRARGELA